MVEPGVSVPTALSELRRDSVRSIPGWFPSVDRMLFRWFLEQQTSQDTGDLAELGAYLGKSASLIGDYVRPGERFTVVDLFGQEADDALNREENVHQYEGLTQQRFELNYHQRHGRLPEVVRGFSHDIVAVAAHGTHRFVHIDASHLFDHVRADIAAAKLLLRPAGVVVFDDIRSAHTPGVAAAVWQAVTTEGLIAIATSDRKLYATWADASRYAEPLKAFLASSRVDWEEQYIAGRPVLRVWTHPDVLDGRTLRESLLRALAPPILVPLGRRLRTRRASLTTASGPGGPARWVLRLVLGVRRRDLG